MIVLFNYKQVISIYPNNTSPGPSAPRWDGLLFERASPGRPCLHTCSRRRRSSGLRGLLASSRLGTEASAPYNGSISCCIHGIYRHSTARAMTYGALALACYEEAGGNASCPVPKWILNLSKKVSIFFVFLKSASITSCRLPNFFSPASSIALVKCKPYAFTQV